MYSPHKIYFHSSRRGSTEYWKTSLKYTLATQHFKIIQQCFIYNLKDVYLFVALIIRDAGRGQPTDWPWFGLYVLGHETSAENTNIEVIPEFIIYMYRTFAIKCRGYCFWPICLGAAINQDILPKRDFLGVNLWHLFESCFIFFLKLMFCQPKKMLTTVYSWNGCALR